MELHEIQAKAATNMVFKKRIEDHSPQMLCLLMDVLDRVDKNLIQERFDTWIEIRELVNKILDNPPKE